MKLIAYGLTAFFVFISTASASYLKPLISPEELYDRLDQANPIILDIRGDAYNQGHIPGSISAPYAQFRGPKNNPGQLLDEDTLEQRFEALGLELDRPVVIVSEGRSKRDFSAAARVYWTLKSSGFTDLAVLDGGNLGWEAAGKSIDKISVTPRPTELDITFSKQWTATTEQIVSASKGEIDSLLLDSRSVSYFEGKKGHPAAARPGTLPRAENYDYSSFFEKSVAVLGEIVGIEPGQEVESFSGITDVAALASKLGIEPGQEVVSFCNTGHTASTNWFALSEIAGLDNVKLYPGSMVEYSHLDLPMENTPGVFENLLNSITGS